MEKIILSNKSLALLPPHFNNFMLFMSVVGSMIYGGLALHSMENLTKSVITCVRYPHSTPETDPFDYYSDNKHRNQIKLQSLEKMESFIASQTPAEQLEMKKLTPAELEAMRLLQIDQTRQEIAHREKVHLDNIRQKNAMTLISCGVNLLFALIAFGIYIQIYRRTRAALQVQLQPHLES